MKKLVLVNFVSFLLLFNGLPTYATEGIVVQNQTMVFSPDKTGVTVQTMFQIINTSSTPQEIAWELPPSIEQLQILAGGQDIIVVDQKKLQRTNPLAGGAQETIVYKYRYPFSNQSKSLVLPLSYPVQNLEVLLPEEYQKENLESKVLQNQGPIQFEGKTYLSYVGGSISDPSIEIALQGASTVPFLHSEALIKWWSQSVFRSINPHLVSAIFVILIGGVGYYIRRSYQGRKVVNWMDEEEQHFLGLYHKHQLLFTKLEELQNQLESGLVSSEEHAKLKEIYKDNLVVVFMELKKYTS